MTLPDEAMEKLRAELERCSNEIWDSLPSGDSGIRNVTLTVGQLSAYVDVMTDAIDALASSERKDVELGRCARQLVNGSVFDLTDSPKSLISQLKRLVAETDAAMKGPTDDK